MKKKFFVTAAIAALMGVGAYFGHATATPADTSDLLLANAEALADDTEKPGYNYVVRIPYENRPDGCNCTGKGNKECCY